MSEVRKRVDEEPQKIQDDPACEGGTYHWTCPAGYKHPTCAGCDKPFFKMKPQRCIGNASVPSGVLCWGCTKKLDGEEFLQ